MPTRPASSDSARRWLVTGRVQGVGFRSFVQRRGSELNLVGWVRNLDDGRVEAYAVGSGEQLDLLAAALYVGPRFCEVRAVEEQQAAMQQLGSFEFR